MYWSNACGHYISWKGFNKGTYKHEQLSLANTICRKDLNGQEICKFIKKEFRMGSLMNIGNAMGVVCKVPLTSIRKPINKYHSTLVLSSRSMEFVPLSSNLFSRKSMTPIIVISYQTSIGLQGDVGY